MAKPRPSVDDPGSLRRAAVRIELLAETLFLHENPTGSWERETAMLDRTDHAPPYSEAPRFRRLAELAIAKAGQSRKNELVHCHHCGEQLVCKRCSTLAVDVEDAE